MGQGYQTGQTAGRATGRAIETFVEYEVAGEMVVLSLENIRDYMVSGNAKQKVTPEELVVFMNLCRYNHLNPWLKEAYCIKFGNEPATMVVSKGAYLKRAENNPHYDGCIAGIIALSIGGELSQRKGAIVLPGERLIGGYAEVWRKDRAHPTCIEVSLEEYTKKNTMWAEKPATMIRKVALVQALREAFPGEIDGIYTAEEHGMEEGLGAQSGAYGGREVLEKPVDPFLIEQRTPPSQFAKAAQMQGRQPMPAQTQSQQTVQPRMTQAQGRQSVQTQTQGQQPQQGRQPQQQGRQPMPAQSQIQQSQQSAQMQGRPSVQAQMAQAQGVQHTTQTLESQRPPVQQGQAAASEQRQMEEEFMKFEEQYELQFE